MALGLATGIAAVCAPFPGLAFGAVAMSICLFGGWRTVAKFVVSAAVGGGLCLWQLAALSPESPPETGSAQIKVTVIDRRAVGDAAEWLPNPRNLFCRLESFRHTPSDRWRPENQIIAVSLKKDAPLVSYGGRLKMTGVFLAPESAVHAGGFDFKRYLRARGAARWFQAESFESIGVNEDVSTSWLYPLLSIRNRLLLRMSDGLDEGQRRIVAALFFGCRQGLNWDDRREFIESGTIHLFAISGLHVGILATVFLLFARAAPFRWRYRILPVVLLLYVATLGFQPSAWRAWLMISIWSWSRAALRKPRPLNNILLAAAVVLLFNPLALFELGFIYSFTAAGFLVMGWHSTGEWLRCAGEKWRWLPPSVLRNSISWHRLLTERIISILAAGLIASLASLGVTVFYRGFLVPTAVFANLCILPWLWCLFLVAILKVALGWIWFAGAAITGLMALMLSLMRGICAFFAGLGLTEYIGSPPLWSLALFYVALAALALGRRRLFPAGAALLAAVLIFWGFRGGFGGGTTIVFHGGSSQEPAVLMISPSKNQNILLNMPSKEACAAVRGILRHRGQAEIDTVVVQRARREFCEGFWRLIGQIKINRLIVPGTSLSRYASEMVAAARQAGVKVIEVGDGFAADGGEWYFSDGRIAVGAMPEAVSIRGGAGQPPLIELENKNSGERFLKLDGNKEILLINRCPMRIIETIKDRQNIAD